MRSVDCPDLRKLDFHFFICASLDFLRWFCCFTDNFNNRLSCDFAHILSHMFADGLIVDKSTALNSFCALSNVQEVDSAFTVRSVESATNSHFLSILLFSNITDFRIFFCESNFWITIRLVQRKISEKMCTDIVWIFFEFLLCCKFSCNFSFLPRLLSFFCSFLITLFAWLLFTFCTISLCFWFLLLLFRWGFFSLFSWCRCLSFFSRGTRLSWLHNLHRFCLFHCWWGIFENLLRPFEVRCKTVPCESIWVDSNIWNIVSNYFHSFFISLTWLITSEPSGVNKFLFDLVNHMFLFVCVAKISERRQ